MTRARLAILILGTALAFATPARAVPRSPREGTAEWLPVRDPIDFEYQQLRAAGLADTAVVLNTRPLDRRTLAAVVARARRLHPGSRDPALVRLERTFARELVDWGHDAPRGYTTPLATVADSSGFRARLFAYADGALDVTHDLTQFEDRSRFGGRLNLESGGLLLHLDAYAGRVENAQQFSDQLVTGSDFISYSEDTYGSLTGHGLDATLGRIGFAYGPGATGSLLWSAGADPVTALQLGATMFGHLRAVALTGDVDASSGARIAAHRIEWFPSPALTVGLGEAARYGSGHWEPLYLVPLPYTWVQRMLAHDQLGRTGDNPDTVRNNIMGALDVSWRARPGTTLYGEFLLDDQGLKTSGSPTRIGYQAGASLTGATGKEGRWNGRLEYTRVYRYVYAVYYGEDFIHHAKPIGYPAGPNSRTVFGEGKWSPTACAEFTLQGAQEERGVGGLGESYDPAGGPASGSELSGIVERTRRLGAEARWWPRDGVDLAIGAGHDWIHNAGHVDGASESRWELRLSARLRK